MKKSFQLKKNKMKYYSKIIFLKIVTDIVTISIHYMKFDKDYYKFLKPINSRVSLSSDNS